MAATTVAAQDPGERGASVDVAAGGGGQDEGSRWLDPALVRLHRGPTGVLRVTLADRSYLQVSVFQAFPLSDPDQWVVLLDAADREIGTLRDLAGLEPESEALLRQELQLRYLVPHVREIVRISEDRLEGGGWRPGLIWDLDTDRGRMRLRMPTLSEHVRALGPGRLLLLDRDGARCEIRDVRALPLGSQRWVHRYLWGEG